MHSALEQAGIQVTPKEVPTLGTVLRIPADSVRAALTALRDAENGFEFMVDLFGIDTGEGIDAVYHLRSFDRAEDIILKAAHPYGGVLDSVWDVYLAALMPERELCELFGMRLAGHPNPKRLLTTDGCEPFLLKAIVLRSAEEVRNRALQVVDRAHLKRTAGSLAAETSAPVALGATTTDGMTALGEYATPLQPASIRRAPAGVDLVGTEHLIVNMGPQHPSTHGVLRLMLEIDGEEVVTGEAVVGQLHRGIEKLAESRRYGAIGTLMDRGDYVSGIHGELAVALATEKLLGIEAPPRAQWLRCLFGELNRIASHFVWFGPNALDSGMMGLFLYTFKDREAILDILEDVSGQRMMFNYVRPGGVLADITPSAEAKIRAFVKDFGWRMDEHEEIVMGNEIFQSRTRGVGVLTYDAAIAYGLTGANLRASGSTWDVRRNRPYAAYSELDFDVPTASEGDIYARFEVRIGEMRQALRMIEQCIDGLPEGDVMAKVPKILRPPAGEAYAAVESPRGELGVHIVSDGGDTPYRMRYRPPALFALQAGESLLPGLLIADSVVALGSLDFVLGEIDR
ncbi:MAG: NADH-quinone oxidoreductase subunit D [Coriobacteriia bacterium]|nr:NADH-quinone oxidoreductase subunit D [Coriobacteriia bacterium]